MGNKVGGYPVLGEDLKIPSNSYEAGNGGSVGSGDVDGGNANSIYLQSQLIDGGNAIKL